MPAEPQPLTVAQVVNRAVDVCDPMGADEDLAQLFARFEDSDEPVRAVPDLGQRVAEALGAIDPDGDNPALAMAGAVATYLAFRRDAVTEAPADVLRLAARAEFDGAPPEPIADWLRDQGARGA